MIFLKKPLKNMTQLQVRRDKGSENGLAVKHMVMACSTKCRGCVGSKPAHNTRVEYFWREYNVDVANHSRDVFETLQSLGHLGADDGTDLQLLHCACACVVNQKNHDFKECCDHRPPSATGHKIPHILCTTRIFNNQVINSILDPETLHHLHEQQSMPPASLRQPIVNPSFHIELAIDQNPHDQHSKPH